MPYMTMNELPDSIRKRMPPEAQKVYMKAFNSALETYKGDEAAAARVAMAAVMRQFHRGAGGQWIGRKEAKEMNKGRLLYEAMSLANTRVDRAARMIHGLTFMGPESAHGYKMKPQYLEATARRLNESGRAVKCFVNHHDPAVKGRWADARDLAGTFVNARMEGGKVRCDLKCRVGSNGDMIMDDAEANPEMIGFSAQHRGRTAFEGRQEWCVELQDVVRGDYVPDPATTAGMFESESGSHDEPNDTKEDFDMEWSDVTIEGLRVNRPELYESIQAPVKTETEALKGQIKTLDESKTAMGTELAALKQKDAERAAEDESVKLLAEAKISDAAAKELKPLLLRAPDKAGREQIMKAFKTLHEGRTVLAQERQEPRAGEPKGDFGSIVDAA